MNFMDVRSFRRPFLRGAREVGGGVLTGCRNIRSLTVHMGVDEESALRDFVTEINERVTVHVFIQSGSKSNAGRERHGLCTNIAGFKYF